jgi:hypothetical protein
MPDLRAICNTASGLRQPVGGGIILTDPSGSGDLRRAFNFDAFAIMICRMKRTTNGDLRQWREFETCRPFNSVLKKMPRAQQLIIKKVSLFSTSARRLLMQKGQPLH